MKQITVVNCIVAPCLLIWCSITHAVVADHPFFRVLGVVIVWGADDWQENAGNAPIVSDFVLMNTSQNTAGTDIIAGDVYTVVKNSLLPSRGSVVDDAGSELFIRTVASGGSVDADSNNNNLLDIGDSFNAFELSNRTDLIMRGATMHHSFYVASNVAFDIYAQAENLITSGDFTALSLENIRWQMGVKRRGDDGLAYGNNAQNPSIGGLGVVGNDSRLDTMIAPTKVFDGGRRTAATPGTIAQQSVRFTAKYELRRTGANPFGYDLSMGKGHIETDVTYTIYVP